MSQAHRFLVVVAAVAVTVAAGSTANATAPPVGPLPPGPSSPVGTSGGPPGPVALPQRSGVRNWRIARAYDPKVVTEIGEGNLRNAVVVVFRAVGHGKTMLRFALTRGESARAYESRSV